MDDFSQHPVDQLIRALIRTGRAPTADQIGRIVERVAAAAFDLRNVSVRPRHRGLAYQGITLGSRAASPAYHLIKRVVVEEQWAHGTTVEQYIADLRRAARAVSTRLVVFERHGEHFAGITALTDEVVPVDRRGTNRERFVLVVFSADRGIIVTGYQFSDLSQVNIPGGVQWHGFPNQPP